MAYGLLPQVAICLAIMCVKFPAIHAQDFLQIAQNYKDRRTTTVPPPQAPVYMQMLENNQRPVVPQGVPDYIKLTEGLMNGQNAAGPLNPPTDHRPPAPTVSPVPPQTPSTTTYGPIISAIVTHRPTTTTSSYNVDDSEEQEEDPDKIFFEDWETVDNGDNNSSDLNFAEGRQRVVVKRDQRGRYRPAD